MEIHSRLAGYRGDVVIVDVCGPITDGDAPSVFRDTLKRLLDCGYKGILVNVADVTYVDSVWLGAVVHAYASAVRRGGAVKLLNVRARFRELLRVTKLDTVFDLFESEETAAASFDAFPDADPHGKRN